MLLLILDASQMDRSELQQRIADLKDAIGEWTSEAAVENLRILENTMSRHLAKLDSLKRERFRMESVVCSYLELKDYEAALECIS